MTGPENWRVAYPAFGLGMAVIGGCTYLVLRKVYKKPDLKRE